MLSNDKVTLIFGLDDEEKAALHNAISKEELPSYKVITSDMASMTIKDILSGLKFEVYDNTLPKERVVLFNNFTDDELERGIKAIRASMTPGIIMAIVTPTSIEWTFKYLLEHLIEEREWYRAQKRGTKGE
jgi:hypothetical protein